MLDGGGWSISGIQSEPIGLPISCTDHFLPSSLNKLTFSAPLYLQGNRFVPPARTGFIGYRMWKQEAALSS
jgi:hypothetical protein